MFGVSNVRLVGEHKIYGHPHLNELKWALRSGEISIKGSRSYKNFDDYLIS